MVNLFSFVCHPIGIEDGQDDCSSIDPGCHPIGRDIPQRSAARSQPQNRSSISTADQPTPLRHPSALGNHSVIDGHATPIDSICLIMTNSIVHALLNGNIANFKLNNGHFKVKSIMPGDIAIFN